MNEIWEMIPHRKKCDSIQTSNVRAHALVICQLSIKEYKYKVSSIPLLHMCIRIQNIVLNILQAAPAVNIAMFIQENELRLLHKPNIYFRRKYKFVLNPVFFVEFSLYFDIPPLIIDPVQVTVNYSLSSSADGRDLSLDQLTPMSIVNTFLD